MGEEQREFLNAAKAAAMTSPTALTVRELLAIWHAKRRGYWIVERIRDDLQRYGLTTYPDFNEVWIDSTVEILPIAGAAEIQEQPEGALTVISANNAPREVYLRVNSLASANSGVTSVSPQDSIQRAQSLMMRYNYSQVPILSGTRDLRGAVSWESIAQARIRSSAADLADATVPAELVRDDDDLLALIPRIVSHGFVFVQAKDRQVVGIVTTADLSEAIASTANPFFVLAEVERQLRDIIDDKFTPEELAAVLDPQDRERDVSSADQLTFGEYKRLIEVPDNWERLAWDLDRKLFVDALDDVRQIRNDIMHFSPDPLDEEQLRTLADFARWLRRIRPRAKSD